MLRFKWKYDKSSTAWSVRFQAKTDYVCRESSSGCSLFRLCLPRVLTLCHTGSCEGFHCVEISAHCARESEPELLCSSLIQRHEKSMTISDTRLASLALTHVYYDPSDIFGLPSAFLALFPQALIVAYIVAIYSRREVETAYMFIGQLGCEALNWILKRLIKQDRPQRTV